MKEEDNPEPSDPGPDPGTPERENVPQGADPGTPGMEYFEKGKNVEPDDDSE